MLERYKDMHTSDVVYHLSLYLLTRKIIFSLKNSKILVKFLRRKIMWVTLFYDVSLSFIIKDFVHEELGYLVNHLVVDLA